MKRIYCMLLMLVSIPALACDICGSGAGGSYLGLLPQFRKHFFGFRYQQNSLVHHLGAGGSVNYLTTTETYRITEFWGAANIGSRFRITAFIPFNFIQRTNQQEHLTDQGMGDVTVIGYYQLLNTNTEADPGKLVQSLWIGAGVKLPSGKYNPEDKNIQQSAQNTFQLGTGSTDLSVHAMYDLRLQQTGININAGYKMKTRNKYDYQYGNKFTLNTLAYHRFSIADKINFLPNAGVLYETSAKDWKTKDIQVWETGGYSLMGTIGLEFSAGRISAGVNFQTPLSQRLGEGKVKGKERGMVHVGIGI
jgi:hypothetical protein